MDNFFLIAALVSMGGVVAVLVLGLKAMSIGTEKAQRISNRMMQLRVIFQAMAVIFLVLSFSARG